MHFSIDGSARKRLSIALATVVLIGASMHRVQAQGGLVSWGEDLEGQVSGTPTGFFIAVAAGAYHSVAIRADGSLVSWGWDAFGQVSNTPAGTYTKVAAGEGHSVALKTDGTLVTWGGNYEGQLNGLPSGTFTDISCGLWHNAALRTDGSLVEWGSNNSGQLDGLPAGVFTDVACGWFHNLALRSNGTLASWGWDATGEVSLTPAGTYTAVFAGGFEGMAIRPDGTLALWGMTDAVLPGTFIAAAFNGSLAALRPDGTLLFYGLGAPSGTFTAVEAGLNHFVAIRTSTNRAPMANAGPDQSVDESALVLLSGAGSSDPDNDALSYEWRQVAGPAVGLYAPPGPTASFVAPIVPLGGATLTFELTVRDGSGSRDTDFVDIKVANVNHAPVAAAGDDQTVAEASRVTLDGSQSYDLDFDSLEYTWMQSGGTPVSLDLLDRRRPTFVAPIVGAGGEALTFELTVNDGFSSGHDTVSVRVENLNHDPAANAGADQTRMEGATVALDGSLSSDPDGDSLAFSWVQISGPAVLLTSANTASPSFTAPEVSAGGAVLVFSLSVGDGYSGASSDQVEVNVQDRNAPPDCSTARPDSATLWPPDHKMIAVDILGVTDPENGAVSISILSVTQDEPVTGLGDGDTGPDAVIQGGTVLLRAERSGTGNGRVYRITFQATDGASGSCTGTVTVSVPHSKSKNAPAPVDDGQIYGSLGS